MDSSTNNTTSTTTSSSYQEVPNIHLSSSSLFDPLPSYLPTFRSSATQLPPPSSSSSSPSSSKKRSRASRRAPTTVLTTDPSNFRAMVQEFTGFPTPPFPSSFPRPSFHHLTASMDSYSFLNNNPVTIAAHANINPVLSAIAAPTQFGDLASLVVQAPLSQISLHHQIGHEALGGGGGLPSWQRNEFGSGDDRLSGRDDRDDDDQLRLEKRQKSSDIGINSWIHESSDD